MRDSPFASLPNVLKTFYFDFDWVPEKVWKISAKTELLPRAELDWHLALPFWSSSEEAPLFDIVPNDVLSNEALHPFHYKRVRTADISFPIDVMWNIDRYVILDGMHRLARLKLEGIEAVNLRKIPRDAIPKIFR